ncbi:MAG TPA: glycosyltransferase family 39 protein [Opitutaceae bacterium]|nr:glycosyltransferase family 39 protein [Opitutaceae bacterium]
MNPSGPPIVADERVPDNPIGPVKRLPGPPGESWLLVFLFGAALITHFSLATFNWQSGFLVEHEFRQTHTAIITYYLDQENRFSLHYTTPLFGKPWSVPMEFPIYEWSVVLVSRAAHVPHFEAARGVSLACFYLMLPAVWLLLGSAGLPRPRRLLGLALILTCPVYIFYSRTFLMESMVLMFSVWFLATFVRTLQKRQWGWLVPCALCGTASGLIKSTTFFAWLLPAALYGAYALWCDLRQRVGWRSVARTVAWGLGAAVVPCAAVYWWVTYTDAIKAPHPSAFIFTSRELTKGNFGMYSLAARLSAETWRAFLANWQRAIMSPWLMGVLVAAGAAFFRRQRWPILGAVGLFLAAQLLFPFAYVYQDYYLYACVVFFLVGLGYVLHGVLDSRLPRWLGWIVVIVPMAAMLGAYAQGYYLGQKQRSSGGSGMADAIKAITPKGSVIIVIGADWAPMIPYYSERKALMVRHGLESNSPYLARAFHDLADENVSALVMAYDQRGNVELARQVATAFNLDSSVTFTCPFADVYLSNFIREQAVKYLSTNGRNTFNQVTTTAHLATGIPNDSPPNQLTPGIAAAPFRMISPLPSAYRFRFGYSYFQLDGADVLSVHPDCDLWVPAPAGATEIRWEFGIVPGAYEREGSKTNGVDFIVDGEAPDGSSREVFSRLLNPAEVPADRGRQRVVIPYHAEPGEKLVFRTRPHGDYGFDWAYWVRIAVQ